MAGPVMSIVVDFQDESLEFDLPEQHLVAAWRGPAGMDRSGQREAIKSALETPWDFPPLRQMVVPGDRIVFALDPTISDWDHVIAVLTASLQDAGIEPGSVTVLSTSRGPEALDRPLPPGTNLVVHDPTDRGQLSYLAATKGGRRIYLNRLLTDADVVIPVGRLGYDPIMGYRGPWSVLFPGLSDRAAIEARPAAWRDEDEDLTIVQTNAGLDESFEVSWLLGTQFHVGVVPGLPGSSRSWPAGIRRSATGGSRRCDGTGRFVPIPAPSWSWSGSAARAAATTFDDLAEGLATACRLVQHGGKIVVLSRVRRAIGPALRSLIDADDPKARPAALRGHEGDDDFLAARRLAQALAWADVFRLERPGPRTSRRPVLVALENPEQARRLVARGGSCSFVSQAELTRSVVRRTAEVICERTVN